MQILVYGGSSSGKSALAEKLLTGLEASEKVYIAAMQPFGAEDFEKISRHREMRLGKGFVAIEKYTNLFDVKLAGGSAVLLECLTNLVANEMFSPCASDPEEVVLRGVEGLRGKAEHLIIVSGEVCADGYEYSAKTLEYQQLLARVNRFVASQSDVVIETVCGIPIFLKGEALCTSLNL